MTHNTTCTFTGHRPFKLPWGFEEDHPDCIRLKLMLSMEIESRIASGCCNFFTGMCWGADIWCSEIVLNLQQAFPEKKIRLTAVLPFVEHHAGWTREYQERYFSILEQTDECVILHNRYADGCYQERNKYMVDRSGLLIAAYGGGSGGTNAAVNYAKQRGLEIVVFHPVQLTREQISGRRALKLVK